MHDNPTAEQPIWRFAELLEQLSQDKQFIDVAGFSEGMSLELYKPVGNDAQSPHTRDELYIVSSGSGTFYLQGDTFPFDSGDLIFVPAHAEHRFESFSEDFTTWVIFFGPERTARS